MTQEQKRQIIQAIYPAAQNVGGGPWVVDVHEDTLEPIRVRHETHPGLGVASFVGSAWASIPDAKPSILSSGKRRAKARAALEMAHKAWEKINGE